MYGDEVVVVVKREVALRNFLLVNLDGAAIMMGSSHWRMTSSGGCPWHCGEGGRTCLTARFWCS